MENERCFDALRMVKDACQRNEIDLGILVAGTSIWAHPEVHRRLFAENGNGVFFPNLRRARVGAGERRGISEKGVRLDDNNGPNQAIKKAIGLPPNQVKGFETCHIWPGTTYDERYHTAIANLVLLPRALASLSDHDPDIQAMLQFRSFELYGWHPAEVEAPTKPKDYPTCWREPEPFSAAIAMTLARRYANATQLTATTSLDLDQEVDAPAGTVLHALDVRVPDSPMMPPDELRDVIDKLRGWARKPHTKVHRILGLITRAQVAQPRQQLAKAIEAATGSANGYVAIANLLTSKGNAYGRVLIDRDGLISFHPDVVEEVKRHQWA